MGTTNEYAKLVRVTNGNTTDRGFQAKITLPVYKDLTNKYVYAYFAVYCGLGNFECGISTKSDFIQNDVIKWHWFVHSPDGNYDSGNMLYSDSSTVHISLEANTNNKIVFKVNGNQAFISTSNFFTNYQHTSCKDCFLSLPIKPRCYYLYTSITNLGTPTFKSNCFRNELYE